MKYIKNMWHIKKPFLILMLCIVAAAAVAEDYSLEDYLARVEKFSKDLILSRQDVEKADVTVTQARSALLPTIGVQAGYTRNLWDIEQSTPIGASTTSTGGASPLYPLIRQDMRTNTDNELSLGLGVEQNVFNMKAIAALRASRQYRDLYGTAYTEAKRQITNAARKAYFGAVLLREMLSVREASEKNNQAAYEDMRKQYEAGMARELDMLLAEVAWQQSVPAVTQARRDLENALIQIKTLADIELGDPIALTTPLDSFPQLPQEVSPEESYSRRTDYQFLLQQRDLADISIDLALADFFPTISASLGLSRQGRGDQAKLMDTHTDVLQLGVKIALPVYTGGARRSQLEIEKINLRKHDTELAKMRDFIQAEITRLYLSLRESWERIGSSKITSETADKAYRLVRLSLANGMATQLEVNTAAVRLEEAQLAYYNSVYDYLTLYFDWEKALGL
ncbi:MAG: TolC family protein [Spirochaetales bacterium]|nr:TolC family protein [Spirochaetales bacterium]